ncbi:MAG: hypothetical protein NTV70_13680 [Acidobacteria bacterium]|nr:hypothetical protein [Acidobacteriota bacterium]
MPTWAEWAGFAISIIGFGITIWQIIEAKQAARNAQSAAEHAQAATIRTRASILRVQALSQLERAVHLTRGLKELHRRQAWELALQSSDQASEALQAFRDASSELTEPERLGIQGSIQELATMRELIEEGAQPDLPSLLNRALDQQLDKLSVVLAQRRQREEGE